MPGVTVEAVRDVLGSPTKNPFPILCGTSAGASIQSSHMVAFGAGGATPKQRMTQLAAGLGLLDGCVIDQHFEQRNRYGRLLMCVSQSPSLLGIGVDEDTAAIITHEDDKQILRVAGRGAVAVFDAVAGVEPSLMGLGPIPATRKLLSQLDQLIQQLETSGETDSESLASLKALSNLFFKVTLVP